MPIYCNRCGRALTNPVSVERHFGPVCWGKVKRTEEFLTKLMDRLFDEEVVEVATVETGPIGRIRTGYREWADVPERKRSPEVDFGVHWREEGARFFGLGPTWRVSWIRDTGELYAVEQSPEHDRFVVLGVYQTYKQVERAMEGWAEGPMRIGPLVNSEWLYERRKK